MYIPIQFVWTGLLVLLYSVPGVRCFNIDIDKYDIFSGDADSYFGYSIVLAGNKWVITGAPRANSSDLPIENTGAVYRCYSLAGVPNCEEIHIDGKFETDSAMFDNKLIFFEHGREGQWLGGSIELIYSGSGWEILTCAPRWYNRKFKTQLEYDMNGLCYLIPSDLQIINIRKLPAMVGASKRTAETSWGEQLYNYGMAGMGGSLHVTKETQTILMGAPGMKYWTGGFVEMDGKSVEYMESYLDSINVTQDSYVGYAMTSGRYFSDRFIYYAIGAPRADLTGKVYFFRSDAPYFLLQTAASELKPSTENDVGDIPINSYFGSVLCTEDVNADGYDDLMVGAPMWSNPPPEFENGVVYLYLGTPHQEKRFHIPNLTLRGSESSTARFGSAISSLGDINADGFSDIIIGAPYEDDGRGAVYMYNGYSSGVWPKYSLRILGRNVDEGLFGFGASISNSMDMNRDNINDIAVGAYLSNNVVLLYGQPVIHMESWLEIVVSGKPTGRQGPAMIRRNTSDIYIATCFRFTDSIDTQSITLNVILTLDSNFSESPRLLFKDSNSNSRTLQVKVWRGDTTCTVPQENNTAYVQTSFDLVSPVTVLSTYIADNIAYYGDGVEPTINRFTGDNPRDPQLEVSRELHFLKDCDNNICHTDLHLATTIDYKSIDNYFIIGTQLIKVHVSATTDGDPSYGSAFHLTFPWFLRYRKTDEVSVNSDLSCTIEARDKTTFTSEEDIMNANNTLTCFIGNPMYNNSGVEFDVFLQVPSELSEPSIGLYMNVTTLSNEMNHDDNAEKYAVEAVNNVKSSISGISNPPTMFINNKREVFTSKHIYEFANAGPSPLPRATMEYYVPKALKLNGSHHMLYLNETKFDFHPTCEINCTMHQTRSSPSAFVRFNGKLENVTVKGVVIEENMGQGCEHGDCPFLVCSVVHLPARTTIVTTLSFVIRNNMLENAPYILHSKAEVILDEDFVLSNRLMFEKLLRTELLPEAPPKEEVEVWVLVVSVTIGIILLLLLIGILFKLGFFKRGLRDELVRQKSIRSTRSRRSSKDHPEKDQNDPTLKDDDILNDDQTQMNDKAKILEQNNDNHATDTDEK